MNDFLQPSWTQVRHKVEQRLLTLRDQLESPEVDFAKTQCLRGEIRALKRLLDLPVEIQEARQSTTALPGWPGSDVA